MGKTKVLNLLGIDVGLALFLLFLLPGQVLGQSAGATTHTIFMAVVEIKGGTSAEKLAPPAVNPKDLSKGYDFKAPGEADKSDPKRWEVSTYLFSPSSVTVCQVFLQQKKAGTLGRGSTLSRRSLHGRRGH